MFTGIIKTVGKIVNMEHRDGNLIVTVASEISGGFSIDQSVAHNGVCLTVIDVQEDTHKVEAVAETLAKSNLGAWEVGDAVNLESALKLDDRLDGHLVQGHVDTVARCNGRKAQHGSTLFIFEFPKAFAAYIIEKGSIAVNGVSLTAFDVSATRFSVAVIPFTLQHTNLNEIRDGSTVNLEFDLVGKYILRSEQLAQS